MSKQPARTRPLPREVIITALGKIEAAMGRGNQEEALRALEVAFRPDSEPITPKSSVNDLEMNHRLACILEARGVFTIEQLCTFTPERLRTLRSLGPIGAVRIRLALRQAGYRLRNARKERLAGAA